MGVHKIGESKNENGNMQCNGVHKYLKCVSNSHISLVFISICWR